MAAVSESTALRETLLRPPYLEDLVAAGVLEYDPDVAGYLVRYDEQVDEAVWIIPMIFNDRIVCGPRPSAMYEHGWCYDKGAPVITAALSWDPSTQDEPAAFKKRASPGRRRAPGGQR